MTSFTVGEASGDSINWIHRQSSTLHANKATDYEFSPFSIIEMKIIWYRYPPNPLVICVHTHTWCQALFWCEQNYCLYRKAQQYSEDEKKKWRSHPATCTHIHTRARARKTCWHKYVLPEWKEASAPSFPVRGWSSSAKGMRNYCLHFLLSGPLSDHFRWRDIIIWDQAPAFQ